MTGLCVDSPDFASYANGALDQLIRRGNWFGTIKTIRTCVRGHCVVWPRQVGTILALNVNGQPSDLFNRWYGFMPDGYCGKLFQRWNAAGRQRGLTTESDGNVCVFNPIPCNTDVYLQFFISNPTDAGKTITVLGIDSNGQPVRTQRSDGTVQDGVVLTLAKPFVQSPMMFRKVTRVIKGETNYTVRGYQYNPATQTLDDLCSYEPSETNPEYVHSRISCGVQFRGSGCLAQVEALVKLKFTPVKYDDDLLVIDNDDALANMMMSKRFKEMGDVANTMAYEAQAFRELNYQMKDVFPDEQFVCNFLPFGRYDALNGSNIRIGMI